MTSYDVVVADPNWPEQGGGGRGAQEHYEVQSVNTIIGEMQNADAFKTLQHDCLMYLWATSTFLIDAARIFAACGFRYVSSMTWPKVVDVSDDVDVILRATEGIVDDAVTVAAAHLRRLRLDRSVFVPAHPGLGQRTRQQHEPILIGVRGTVPFPDDAVKPHSVVFAERGEHSVKPEAFWDRVALAHPQAHGRRTLLDMYSRVVVPGRQAWGTVLDDENVVWIDEGGVVLSSKPLRRQACLL